MNGLDIFSGIGGITKALEGYVRPVAYCENDRYAQGVLLSRMADGSIPTAPIWDDVRTLKASDIKIPVDIVYGGFPCTDISVAGRGAGLAGKQSGLFFEIMRLADEIRPAFIFLENVPAIRKRGGSVVVGELARRGYDCRWITLSAADVGANHKRERWWLLANAESQQDRRLQFKTVSANLGGNSKNVADAAGCRRRQKYTNAGRQSQGTLAPKEWGGPPDSGWWEIEPPVGRLVDGIPFRVGQLRALGNSVVPAQAREAFERLLGIKK